jgi:hypothetical protein
MYSEWERSSAGAELASQGFREESHHEEELLPREHLVSYSLRIGDSLMRFEPPDICIVHYIGDLNGDVVFNMNAALEWVARRTGYIYLMVDLGKTGEVTDEARVGGLRGMRALNPRATAVFGADFHLRVIAGLITKAASLIDARVKGPVSFFAREEEARAWISEIRRRAGSRMY